LGGIVLLFGLLPGGLSIARADQCFCLIHSSSGAMLRGCEEFKAPTDAYSTAVCVDPETSKRSLQTIYSDWKRIDEGADRCKPCRPVSPRSKEEVPRGHDSSSGEPK
jgi:hypothetical protein